MLYPDLFLQKHAIRILGRLGFNQLTQTYSEPCQMSRMDRFAKIVKRLLAVNIFWKTLHLYNGSLLVCLRKCILTNLKYVLK